MNIKYFLEPPPRLPWQWEKQSFEDATPSKNWELDKIIQPIEKPAISRGNTSSNPSSLCSSNWLRMQLLRWPNMTTECTESTCRTTYLKLNLKNHMNINSKSTSIPLSDWNKPCNHQLHWTSKFKMSQPFWSHLFFSHSKTTTWSQVTPSIISAVFPFWSAFESVFVAPSVFCLSWGWVQTDKQGSGPLASREGNSFKLRLDFFETRRQITHRFHFSNYS